MAAVKEKLGRIPCPNAGCGHSVWLKQNELKTLTIACDECDVNMIAKRGTGAARKWLGMLPTPAAAPEEKRQVEPAKPAPAAVPSKVLGKVPRAPASEVPKPSPAVPSPVKKPANPFSMLGL